jgi:Stigma-specific protein, Stig1
MSCNTVAVQPAGSVRLRHLCVLAVYSAKLRTAFSSCGATGPGLKRSCLPLLVHRTNRARFHRHGDVERLRCFRFPASVLMTRGHSHVNRFSLYKHRCDADRDNGATAGFEFDLQTIPRAACARNRWLVATAYMRTDSMRSISIDIGKDWLHPRPGFRLFGRACERTHNMGRFMVRAVNLTALLAALLFLLVPPQSRAQGSSNCGNVLSSAQNCGICGVVCGAGMTCSDGVCSGTSNPTAFANAGASTGPGANTNANSGPGANTNANTGASSNAGNNATTTCNAPQTLCSGRCVNTAFAPKNCGACGVVCAAGQTCANGVCGGASSGNANANANASNNATPTCNAVQTLCGGRCVNTAFAPRNCGACGVVCEAGQKCAKGVCGGTSNASANANASGNATPTCNAPKTLCGGRCVNTAIAPKNCGACGVVCETGQKCAKGVCGGAGNASASCNAPKTLCGGRCVNTAIAPKNCGACGVVCTGGQVCRAGTCSNP